MDKNYVVYSINKVKKMMHHYIDNQLAAYEIDDIVPAYSDILTALYVNDGQLKMNQISHLVGKDKSTITVLVNKLADRGYVEKEKSQLDKRVTYIRLSKKAYSFEDKYLKIASGVRNIAFDGFTEEERLQFMDMLSRIHENFQEHMK